MNQKLKIILGLFVIFVLLAVVSFMLPRNNSNQLAGNSENQTNKSKQSSEYTKASLSTTEQEEDVDSIVDGIAADYADEAAIAAEGDADIEYISESTSFINSSGVYNENEF